MKILNSKEAFDAMMAGRNIMCRAVGELVDFDDLSQFPATIFAMPGYEFCIKIETMELAGITFAKPLKLEEICEGQDIYVINTYGSSIYVVEFGKMTSAALIESINNGFAQHDAENAKLQSQAISKVLGRELSGDCLVVRLGGEEKPKKRRSTKAKNDAEQTGIPAGPGDAAPNIEKQPESEVAETIKTESIAPSIPAEEVLDETDPAIQKFIEAIDKCDSEYALQGIDRNLDGNKEKLHTTEFDELKQRIKDKRISFFPATDSVSKILNAPVEPEQSSKNLSVAELKRLQEEAEKLIHGKAQDAGEEYQTLLTDLPNRASKAATPAEANALVGYTKAWTEEQRKPLIDAIHKRLVELNKTTEQPSLAVRIQKAEDLTELDALEIDVSACDEVIQPRLMELVEQRRIQLDRLLSAGEAS
ncbi:MULTISPECIES: hypothetical protein [unclassified Acinetobacter]|uniref:hypothetical protein n=1 Tax=unclassified Acinetobacter TaxID=196816 RepID=UPI001D0D977D|nr:MULTISPECIES: hypothetical protein [unclassified Acinetobacter]